jgi:hypothetical protein
VSETAEAPKSRVDLTIDHREGCGKKIQEFMGNNFRIFCMEKRAIFVKSRRAKWIWTIGSRRTHGGDPRVSEERYSRRKREQSGRNSQGQSLKQITFVGCGRDVDRRSGPG